MWISFRFLSLALLCIFIFCAVPADAADLDFELLTARGIDAINGENHRRALDYLEEALVAAPDNPETVYYAGIAASRLGRYEQAEDLLLRASKLDGDVPDVHYELGRLFYLTARCERAAASFARYLSMVEAGPLAEQARGMMESCGREVEEEKSYSFMIFAGGQYDTNVILEQENPPIRAEDKDDFRGVFYFTAEALPYRSSTVELMGEYRFYQSLHLELTEFNVQHHKLTPAEFRLTPWKSLVPAVGYSFEYTLFGGDTYSRIHRPYARVTLQEGDDLATELLYEYRDQSYEDTELFPNNAMRSGSRNSLALRQTLSHGRTSGLLFLSGDFDRAEADFWSFDGFTLGANLYYRLSDPVYLSATGEYGRKNFKGDYPFFGEKRKDKVQVYSFGATWQINDKVGLYLSQSFTLNGSNLDIYDYDRSVTSLFITVGLP